MAESKHITRKQLKELAQRSDARLDTLEAATPVAQDLTIPNTGWTSSGDSNYPYQYTLSVSGATTASKVDVVLNDASVVLASACGLSNATETGSGTVIFKSYQVPSAALSGVLYLTKEAK